MTESKPMKRRNFCMPDETYRAMDKAALRLTRERGTKVSVAMVLREAIAHYLKASK